MAFPPAISLQSISYHPRFALVLEQQEFTSSAENRNHNKEHEKG